MKRLVAFSLFLLLSLQAFAVTHEQAGYIGGTQPGFSAGTVGRLDTSSESALIFEYAGKKILIPYSSIESSQCSKEKARDLGILPTIAVGLLKPRQYRHFLRISYRDPGGTAQIAVFEIPKEVQSTLQLILEARAPQSRNFRGTGTIQPALNTYSLTPSPEACRGTRGWRPDLLEFHLPRNR